MTGECIHVSDVGHIERVVHDSVVKAEIITDPLTTDVLTVSEEVLGAQSASEAVIDANEPPPVNQQDDNSNCEDYLNDFLG